MQDPSSLLCTNMTQLLLLLFSLSQGPVKDGHRFQDQALKAAAVLDC